MTTRDIVAIGCSAGGVEALPRVLQPLPGDLRAAVAIVQHLSPTHEPQLVSILQRTSRLPVVWAEQGAPVAHSRVYVAPPDVHLVFTEEHVRLTRGARESHARPSIDKLFRSAAATFGSRVIGVLMTGMLDDGVGGLQAIRAAGGFVIVQDPDDAQFPDLPVRALQALAPDRTLSADAIGATLHELVGEPVAPQAAPDAVKLEAHLDARVTAEPKDMTALGEQTPIACPECGGPMWELGDEHSRRYRCYLGHVSTARTLLADKSQEVESALWSAVRSLHDRAVTLDRLAADAARIGNKQTSAAYGDRAKESREQGDLVRQFLFDLGRAPKA